MSITARHEHLVRLLQGLTLVPNVVAGDKPAGIRVDVRRALTALGLVAICPAVVAARLRFLLFLLILIPRSRISR